jgi:hypothetical protein
MPSVYRSTNCRVTNARSNDRTSSKKSGTGSDHMSAGQTQRELSERKLRIAEYKWKVYPLITEQWQHISKFLKTTCAPGCEKGTARKWTFFALKKLESEGRVESMRDPNFPGTYWRLKK